MTQTLGWILLVVGIALCVGGLALAFMQQQAAKKAVSGTSKDIRALDPAAIQALLDSLSKVLEQFTKLAMPVQFSVLGGVLMVIGTLLITYK
jgi:uncharacterized membrane protein